MKALRVTAIAIILLCIASTFLAQVPAGVSFNSEKHANPIVTWVQRKDFKTSTFSAAVTAIGVDTITLSKDQGQRDSVELASPSPARQKIRIAGYDVEVTFYPVMRQNYKLKSGHNFSLYTFRFPRAATTAAVLNSAAFDRPFRGEVPRFGKLPLPDRIDIRDNPGMYFEGEKERTVYWFELGASHSATTDAPKDELFKVLDDLL
jgi:hypothetical protein